LFSAGALLNAIDAAANTSIAVNSSKHIRIFINHLRFNFSGSAALIKSMLYHQHTRSAPICWSAGFFYSRHPDKFNFVVGSRFCFY
jgi:hypothetical protein